MANLFTDSFFRKQMGRIKAELGIDDARMEEYAKIVQKRVDYVKDFNPDTDSEEKDWPGFERDVFHDLLGYNIKDDDPSDYHIFRQSKVKGAGKHGGTGKTDCTLGFYSKKKERDGNDPVIVEFKAPDTKNLDEAADQLWNYMNRHENCRWGIVSNFNEITLYHRNRERDRKQTFYFAVPDKQKETASPLIRFLEKNETEDDSSKSACIATDKDGNQYDYTELTKFLAIFRKDRLICGQGKSRTEEMLEMQGIEEKKIEKEFYEKYYRLRIDLFNEIALHNPPYRKKRAELVAVTQKILDRLIFIWFCEDSREELLPRSILQRLIGSLMKKSPDLRSENDVWDEIRKLFKAVDEGKGFSIGNGYNAELFKSDPRIDNLVIPNRIFEQQIKPIGEEYDFGHENELSVNILGHIFEQSVTDLEELKQEQPADKKTGKRKREGVYYTPEYITRYIVKQALGGWLEERRKELGKENLPVLTDEVKRKSPKKGGKPAVRKPKITEKMKKDLQAATGNEELITKLGLLKSSFKDEAELRLALSTVPEAAAYTDMIVEMAMPEDADLADWYILEKYWRSYREVLKNVKVLDPACGSGAFLIQAFDYLHGEGEKVNQAMESLGLGSENLFDLDRQILENNLYGVDINDESVEITKLSLWLKTAVKHKKLNNLFNNIKCGNSLIDDPKVAGKKAFRWEKEFPEIMKNGGFDVVIGNPPYVRADIDNPEYQKQRKWMEHSGQYETLYEKWDLMVPFIEKSLKLSKKEGHFSFIVSNSITTSKYAFKLLDWILQNFYLKCVDYFDKIEIFENVGVMPVILSIKKSQQKDPTEKIFRVEKFDNVSIQKVNPNETERIGIKVFKKEYENIDVKVESIKLGDICYMSKGMVLNSDEKTAKGEFAKNDLISDSIDAVHSKKYIEGKNIKRYEITENKYLEWNTGRVPDKLSRATFPELYAGAKIMRGRVTEGIFDDTGIVCNDSIVIFKRFCDLKDVENNSLHNSIAKNNSSARGELEKISEHFDLKYILSILNSKYANKYLNNNRRHRLENYFYPDDFRRLPIPAIDPDQQRPFIQKADIMLDLNRQLAEQKQNMSEYLSVNHNLDSFSQKLQHSENLEFADFIKEVKKKKVNTDDKSIYESIKDFHSRIRQLKSKIDETDREIDKMVYDLYDLTEEERKTVEQACA
ncbi:MAG: DNA methyltransferase [Desulfococcaceae bacterium]